MIDLHPYRGGSDTGRLAIPVRLAMGGYQAILSTDVVSYLQRRLETLNERFQETADVEVLREIEEVQVLLGMPPS